MFHKCKTFWAEKTGSFVKANLPSFQNLMGSLFINKHHYLDKILTSMSWHASVWQCLQWTTHNVSLQRAGPDFGVDSSAWIIWVSRSLSSQSFTILLVIEKKPHTQLMCSSRCIQMLMQMMVTGLLLFLGWLSSTPRLTWRFGRFSLSVHGDFWQNRSESNRLHVVIFHIFLI